MMPDDGFPRSMYRLGIGIEPTATRRAARAAIAASFAYALYHFFALPRGYWAVMTVLIVMQASVGDTIGAALDRLKGTSAGALIGAAALMLVPRTFFGLGFALALITAISTYAATVRSEFRIAPATAAIVLLMHPPGSSPMTVMTDRVLEIAIGGFVGVSASLLIFPERSNTVIGGSLVAVANMVARLLDQLADHLQCGFMLTVADEVVALRAALGRIEQSFADAARERISRVDRHAWPEAIPRTFWCIRSDIALIGRMIEPLRPTGFAMDLSEFMAAELRSDAELARRCAMALGSGSIVDRSRSAASSDDLKSAVDALCVRQVDAADLASVEQVVGLFWTMQRLRGDLTDLADYIDESSNPARVGVRQDAIGPFHRLR
jgi:hypothetical protein